MFIAQKKYFQGLVQTRNVEDKLMKISSISAVDVKKIKAQKYSSNPVNLAINNKQYDANKMFGVYFGKDLVSFKGTDFNQTLKDNYFQLPPGCTPDKFQIDAGKALLAGKDVLVEAPTGTGKTAIAHYAATKNMKEGKTTFYTTPLKALLRCTPSNRIFCGRNRTNGNL